MPQKQEQKTRRFSLLKNSEKYSEQCAAEVPDDAAVPDVWVVL
jgi:hypothetical protein